MLILLFNWSPVDLLFRGVRQKSSEDDSARASRLFNLRGQNVADAAATWEGGGGEGQIIAGEAEMIAHRQQWQQ